jgi:tetratricopeptide (TPR) repeat protein
MVMLRSSVVALAMVLSIAAVEPIKQALLFEDDLSKRAYMALTANDTPSAIEIYSETLRRYPDSYMTYYRRGLTYARMGDLSTALADLDAAVRAAPKVQTANELGLKAWNSLLPETHALNMVVLTRAARADILQQLNRPADAITDLDAAIALDPRRTSLWHRRGLLHMENGNAAAAVADFNALLARRENSEWRFARGISHFVNGNLAEAEADFTQIAAKNPKNVLYARWLARTQKKRGIPI